MSAKLSFLGGAGTVTGSKYLIEDGHHRVLVDCGLFQGFKALRERNWAQLPVEPQSINTVLLTHAHLDHSGFLPRLIKQGFSQKILCSSATLEYCKILLPDSGYLQERDADSANRYGFSRHKPALPLYTEEDAKRSLDFFSPVSFDRIHQVTDATTATYRRAGHILGAATIQLDYAGRLIVFSGDLGRYDDPILRDPIAVSHADYLVVESTYGNRQHDQGNAAEMLAEIITRTTGRGGTVVIPAFAVGRTQSILFHLHQLKTSGRLVNVPIFIDSPMAVNASGIFCAHLDDHKLSAKQCTDFCEVAKYVRDVEQSKALTQDRTPKVIISASGMATGGRVLHHIKHLAPDERNTILFAGYQAAGTRGAAMVAGSKTVKIHGQYVSVRAEVQSLDMLSAHADAGEILRWLRGFSKAPRMTFITHGEPAASDALRIRIEQELGWHCAVAAYGQQVEI
jgi:metallo-beta-lactamase family protein